MSSFLVNPECIIQIVDGIFYLKKRRPSFFPGFPYLKKPDEEVRKEDLAIALGNLNQEAVNQRYREKESYPGEFTPDMFGNDSPDMLQVYKHLKCLGYQCCEGTIPKKGLYTWIREAENAIAHYLVVYFVKTRGETYEDKKWG